MERFFEIWSNLCRKAAPLENPEQQAKKWNFIISASKYQKCYTHEYKNHHSEPENYLLNICIQIKWTYEKLIETWTNIWRKVAPHDNPENTPLKKK